ncbi:MAG: DUF883 family protein [Acidobacteriota bacterium]
MSAKNAQQQVETEVASAAHRAIEEGKDLAQEFREKVVPLVGSARARVSELGRQITTRAKDNAQVVDRYVHDNPWSFIGLGIVTGFLASWYLSSRRDR